MNRIVLLFLEFIVFPLTLVGQQTVGLFQQSPSAFNGYTLFAPLQNQTTYLIDNCGLLVNSWQSSLRPGSSVYLLEDGSLLRAERLDSQNFNSGGKGGRIVRLSWEGDLLWQYDLADETQQQHHDIEFLPNGNILAIVWDLKLEKEVIAAGRNPSTFGTMLWVDKVVELAPIGTDQAEIVWEWHLWDHLIQDFDSTKANYGIIADHPELMDLNYVSNINAGPGGSTDWSHFNAIDYNEELDQILLSSRHFSEIWIIDHSTNTEEAAGHTEGDSGKGGDILYRWGNPQVYNRGTDLSQQLFFQHDASWIPQGYPDEGKIMVYNNGFERPGGNYSSVDIIDPPMDTAGQYLIDSLEAFGPEVPFWIYSGQPDNPFFSLNISGAQRLANGNTLICEGTEGRFFEVDNNGQIVWEYVNPVNNFGPVIQENNPGSNSVFRVIRYAPDFQGLTGRDLSPSEPIELEPLPSDCVTSSEEVLFTSILLYPNPVNDQLHLESSTWMNTPVKLVNTFGQEVQHFFWEGYSKQLDLNALPKGLYFLQIATSEVYSIIKQ